ncbi:MAG: hypothetical protein P8L85_17735, partial [Rubripirellula sp.]|nr:hypothetical protein [Rubripirellula sp.]
MNNQLRETKRRRTRHQQRGENRGPVVIPGAGTSTPLSSTPLSSPPLSQNLQPPSLLSRGLLSRGLLVLVLLTLGLPTLGLTGCARSREAREDIKTARQAFAIGDLESARRTLEPLATEAGPLEAPAALDLAMVELAAGDAVAAERRLRSLRDRFDDLPKINLTDEAVSLVADDTVRMFRPAGYEEVMIRAMLAVCSLAGDQIDAESYSLQATNRQAELAREAEDRGLLQASEIYQPIAMAPYLRGLLREATHQNYDDAQRAYQLVSLARPQFAPAEADIARAIDGTHSRSGYGVLYVIGCVGRGPVLEETSAPTTSQSLSIASAILNAKANQTDNDGQKKDGLAIPNIATVKVPQIALPPDSIAAIGVVVEGKLRGATQTLTDVSELAGNQLQAEQPWTIARAVVRRATKEATVAKASDSIGLEGT